MFVIAVWLCGFLGPFLLRSLGTTQNNAKKTHSLSFSNLSIFSMEVCREVPPMADPIRIPHLTPIWMQQIGKVQGRSKARDKTSLAQKHNNHQTISDTCHIKPECVHTLALGKSQNATAQRASLSAILQKHRSLALGQHPPRPNNGGRDVESSTSQREFINFQWYSKTVSPP